MQNILDDLHIRQVVTFTTRSIDLKHLLSAERAARGSFYATRVGFVAINPKGQRIARSHNGFPVGVVETRERWSKGQKDFYHLHAECAGVFHTLRDGYPCHHATAYVTHPPCPGCMRVLIAAGFRRVVFSEQALLERQDWREDMLRSFTFAREHDFELSVYRDSERSMKFADITRTELELKKVYDELVPQARWASGDISEISRATKPESGDWVEEPVVKTLLKCAKKGVTLAAKSVVMDYAPECRAATAMIQAGIASILIAHQDNAGCDPRWAVPLELQRAADMLQIDAKIPVIVAQGNIERAIDENSAVQFLNCCTAPIISKKIIQL